MASDTYHFDNLRHTIYRPRIESEPCYPTPRFILVELTISLQLKRRRHYSMTGPSTDLEAVNPLQESRRFDLHVLKNHIQAFRTLAPMLRSLGVNPKSPISNAVISNIIQYGLRIGCCMSGMGSKVLPLQVDLLGTIEQAEESSATKMLKRVRVEAEEFDQMGEENIKKRRVEGEDCVMFLDEVKVGSDVSPMTCSHNFLGDINVSVVEAEPYLPYIDAV